MQKRKANGAREEQSLGEDHRIPGTDSYRYDDASALGTGQKAIEATSSMGYFGEGISDKEERIERDNDQLSPG